MGGRGPAPKDPEKRRRTNAAPPQTTLSVDSIMRGPALPDGYTWPTQTQLWWLTWRMSPQAQTLTDTDWDFLLDTALLHAQFWSGDNKVAAELRLRVAKFGATPEDRMRLRLQVTGPDDPSKPAAPEKTTRYGHLRSVPRSA